MSRSVLPDYLLDKLKLVLIVETALRGNHLPACADVGVTEKLIHGNSDNQQQHDSGSAIGVGIQPAFARITSGHQGSWMNAARCRASIAATRCSSP